MFWDRNKIITLSVLGFLSLIAYVTTGGNAPSKVLDIAPEHFAVEDTLTISTITMTHQTTHQRIELSCKSGAWLVNGQYRASETSIGRLLYIIKHVRAKRALSYASAKTIIEKIKTEGILVQVAGKDKLLDAFISDNGDITSSSCFYDLTSQKAYFVELPSFTDNFSQFFKVDANAWRSRLICNNSMKTLESLTSNFSGKVVKFTYKNSFFEIPNVQNIDSNTVGMYLIQFRNLECDGFLEDSMKRLCPKDFKKAFGSVSIQDVDATKNNQLYFFEVPLQKKRFLGYSTKLGECFWMSKSKTFDLLIETEKLFEKQKQQ